MRVLQTHLLVRYMDRMYGLIHASNGDWQDHARRSWPWLATIEQYNHF